jgi:Tfp pilus assembly protein PilO
MSRNNSIQVVLIVLFTILFVLSGYLAINEAIHIGALRAEIRTVQQEILQQKTLLAQLRKLKNNEGFLREQYNEISMLIPGQPFEERLIKKLHQSANNSGIPMIMIKFGKRLEEKELIWMPLEISYVGSYAEFMDLLSEIMYGNRLIRIDELELYVNEGLLEIDILANAFYSN